MGEISSKHTPLPQRRSPRLRDFDYPATSAYSITICTRNRVALFASEAIGHEVANCLEDQAEHSGYRLIAYCIMPDHIHILTGPSPQDRAMPLPLFVRQFKSAATYRLGKLGFTELVWQRSFYDHILRKDEDLAQVANYILTNPVRKGLVQAPEAYALSRCFLETWPA